jgi:hypothetical protein
VASTLSMLSEMTEPASAVLLRQQKLFSILNQTLVTNYEIKKNDNNNVFFLFSAHSLNYNIRATLHSAKIYV